MNKENKKKTNKNQIYIFWADSQSRWFFRNIVSFVLLISSWFLLSFIRWYTNSMMVLLYPFFSFLVLNVLVWDFGWKRWLRDCISIPIRFIKFLFYLLSSFVWIVFSGIIIIMKLGKRRNIFICFVWKFMVIRIRKYHKV